jgi:hypothetical protein
LDWVKVTAQVIFINLSVSAVVGIDYVVKTIEKAEYLMHYVGLLKKMGFTLLDIVSSGGSNRVTR